MQACIHAYIREHTNKATHLSTSLVGNLLPQDCTEKPSRATISKALERVLQGEVDCGDSEPEGEDLPAAEAPAEGNSGSAPENERSDSSSSSDSSTSSKPKKKQPVSQAKKLSLKEDKKEPPKPKEKPKAEAKGKNQPKASAESGGSKKRPVPLDTSQVVSKVPSHVEATLKTLADDAGFTKGPALKKGRHK